MVEMSSLHEESNAQLARTPIVRVIDDDDKVRRSWQFVLEGEGWQVQAGRCRPMRARCAF